MGKGLSRDSASGVSQLPSKVQCQRILQQDIPRLGARLGLGYSQSTKAATSEP